MKHKKPSISDLLSEISNRNISDVTLFLNNNYDLTPELIQSIQQIVEIDKHKPPQKITEIISEVATLLISDYLPSCYIDKNFGDFVSKELIYNNEKSMIFVGSPRSKSYEHDVAIKIISPTHQHIAGNEHLAMQAQYMANIQDANIVEINSAGTTEDGIHYLVMEYLPGLNITEHCIRNKLALDERLQLFVKVCSGIAKMHTKLIIHSDIKPANIIMDINHNPKVIDFDLSQSNSAALHQKFNYKNLKGYTSTYAAPEQLLDIPEITIQTDVYGLGGVLFEILTGYPYSTKSMPTLDCIKNSLGHVKRIQEIAFVIDMALDAKDSSRHASVIDLKNDIQDIIRGERICASYKDISPLSYRFSRFVFRHKIAIATTMIICATIILSVNEVIEEKDNVKRSLQLVMKSNDPRELTSDVMFEKYALESYENSSLNRDEYYTELMGWGETYYGKGMSEKAAKYFKKAQLIYSDHMSNKRITATSRLLQSYYSLGIPYLYRELTEPYLEELQSGEISNPYLIELFLVMSEIESRYNKTAYFGQMKHTANELLSEMNLDEVKDRDLRDKLRISLLIGKGAKLYYSLPHDHITTRSYISEGDYNDTIRPALIQSLALFDTALNIIHDEKIKTHLEPKIYLWIAFLNAELGDYLASETYLDLSLNKTLSIFGEYHPRVTTIYLKTFAMYRYRNPAKALEYAQLAFNTYKQRKLEEHDLQIMTWVYLIVAHFNNGDYKQGIREMKEFRATHGEFDQSSKFIASFMSTTGFKLVKFAYLDTPVLEEIIAYTAELEYSLLELGAKNIDFLWTYLVKARTQGNIQDHARLILEYENYIENSGDFDDDTKVTELLFLLTGCSKFNNCNYMKYVKKVEKYMQWSSLDDKISIEKLTVFLQLSYYYLKAGNHSKAKLYLSEVEPIIKTQSFHGSFHIATFYKLRAEVAYAENNSSDGDKYKIMAIPGALYNFGADSRFTKELMSLN